MEKHYLLITTFLLIMGGWTSTGYASKPKVIDPVCAYYFDMGCVYVDIDENTPRSTYKGTTYYFCSKTCKEYFDNNQEKYLKVVDSSFLPEVTVDLVCGKRSNKSEINNRSTCFYRGKIYYFCSEQCRKQFIENPEHFVRKK